MNLLNKELSLEFSGLDVAELVGEVLFIVTLIDERGTPLDIWLDETGSSLVGDVFS